MKILCYVLIGVLFSLHSASFADTQTDIWSKLKSGGLVVLMKHTIVPKDSENAGSLLLRDPSCKKERNLSKQGKDQAVRIGKKFIKNGVPIEDVLHSPYCRTTETARLAFNINNPVEFLTLPIELPQQQVEKYQGQLTTRIGSYTGKGNLILITHDPNISAISFETVETNTALVLQPVGDDEFEPLGKIEVFD